MGHQGRYNAVFGARAPGKLSYSRLTPRSLPPCRRNQGINLDLTTESKTSRALAD